VPRQTSRAAQYTSHFGQKYAKKERSDKNINEEKEGIIFKAKIAEVTTAIDKISANRLRCL